VTVRFEDGMDDNRVEGLAVRLGDGAERRVDLDRVAESVVARLRAEDTQSPTRWPGVRLWRAAAAVGVLAGGGLVMRHFTMSSTPEPEPIGPWALEELSVPDLNEVLDSLTLDAPIHEYGAVSLDDLNETQLRELLQSMES
jgi:hypothetical protein